MHRQRSVLIAVYISVFSMFVPYTSKACPPATDMLFAKFLAVAALLHFDSGVPTSEASYHQAVCASLLLASDVMKWRRPNATSRVH